MKKKKVALFVGPLALGIAALAMPVSAVAAPQQSGQSQSMDGQDLGPTAASTPITASIVFKIHNQDELAKYIQDTTTPGNPHYQKFLSVNQFRAEYAPSNGDINKVINYLQSYGLTAGDVYGNNLIMQVTGTADQFNAAFNADLHDYSKDGKKFHKPKKNPQIPDILTDSVLTIEGLDSQSAAHPMMHQANGDLAAQSVGTPNDSLPLTGQPGYFTVKDVANMYGANPLYQQGITGKGQTIGIVTLADFMPSDAYTYWDTVGIKYKPNRITQVHVDGGGDFGADAGSGETTLDVQQSGGLAPDADIMVYDAPNTNQGFIDVYYKAISDNKTDTLSVSWGLPEIFYTAALNGGVDFTNDLQAFHQVFMEAAAQGISLFAASGDAGAYDTNRDLPYPWFSKTLSVDAPSSDPYMTAAGGTTAAGTIHLKHGDLNMPNERAWGSDYLNDYLATWYGPGTTDFSDGDGGGVSVLWDVPWYQKGVSGIKQSESGQSLQDLTTTPPTDIMDLPANYAGRNVPDISMDADWYTGYWLLSTADGGWSRGWGGTSFVSPQLNGMTALLDEYNGGRIGFLNPALYRLSSSGAYGSDKALNDIVYGNNWFYNAVPGYDPATGVGTPNIANLAAAIRAESKHK